MTTEEFIEKAKKIHNNKYDYSKTEYKKSKEKVCIICPEHGEFWQTPNMHLRGQGCVKCYHKRVGERCKKNEDVFKSEMNERYGDIYDFSKVKYKNNKTKVLVTCKKHGDFLIRPNDLVSGYGCPECGKEKIGLSSRKTRDEFIAEAKLIHDSKYDYSKVEYKTSKEKVCIICPIHGEFWQTPNHHLRGHGCPNCNESKLEKKVRNYLTEYKIAFKTKKKFDWLNKQHIDFYLPEYNIGIECQGIQHLEPVDFASKGRENEYFKIVTDRDNKKRSACAEHFVPIIYYHEFPKYYGKYKLEAHNKEELINAIRHENICQ